MRILGGDPAEIVPHAADDALDFGGRPIGERSAEVAAGLPADAADAGRGDGRAIRRSPTRCRSATGGTAQRTARRKRPQYDKTSASAHNRRRGSESVEHRSLIAQDGQWRKDQRRHRRPPRSRRHPSRDTICVALPSTLYRDRADEHRQFRPVARSAAFSPCPVRTAAASCKGWSRTMSKNSPPDRAVYAALLTAQGKYLHDFIMVEHGEAIWLDAEAARLADLKRRLSMYRLRAKVEIAERPELGVAAVFGDGALAGARLARRARRGAALRGRGRLGRSAPRRARRRAIMRTRASRRPRRLRSGRGRFRRLRPPPPRRSAFPTAAAISCRTSRSCSNRGSTS